MNMEDQIENILPKGRSKSKSGKHSKDKGKTGERKVANLFTEMSGHSFIRVPNSGAYIGQSNREKVKQLTKVQGYVQLGDIIPPEDFYYRYIIESKNYKELDFHNLLNPQFSKKIYNWLDELEYDIVTAFEYMNIENIIGLLIVNISRKGTWVIGNYDYLYLIMGELNFEKIPVLYFFKKQLDQLKKYNFNDKYFMCDLYNFINNNKHILFKERFKK